jgi:hypothetical protein
MSEQHESDVASALAGLRGAVREVVPVSSSGDVRARAEHQLRVRRVTTVLVAAAAVAAIAFGAAAVVRPSAAPIQPAETPTPSAPVGPTSTPRPSLSVPAWPATTIDDPIADVDWANATIDVPANRDCPSGRLRFTDGDSAGAPKITLAVPPDWPIAYGDLNGDSRPEAILEGLCLLSSEDSGDGQGQLLVITRGTGGTLAALDWVGPRGGLYESFWVVDGQLFVDVQPWHTDWGYSLGEALAYRWDGGSFVEANSGYAGTQPSASETQGPPIDLGPDDGPIASALGCPGHTIRLEAGDRLGGGAGLSAEGDGVVYAFERGTPGPLQHLVELSGAADERHLLAAITCYDSSSSYEKAIAEGLGVRGHGLLVLECLPDGFRAVDFLPVPSHYRMSEWQFDRGRLTITTTSVASGSEGPALTRVWNGQYFQ